MGHDVRKRLVLALLLAGGLALMVGIGRAAIPGSNGAISGCYVKEGAGAGKLRVIDSEAGKTCNSKENPLSWLGVNAKAADSDRFDGLDSTAFLPVGGKAADSNLLDGTDSTTFMRSSVYTRDLVTIGIDPNNGNPCNGNEICRDNVNCDPGDRPLSGGFATMDNGTRLATSWPTSSGWFLAWENNSTEDEVILRVVCVNQT